MGLFSKLCGRFRREEKSFPEERPYVALFIFFTEGSQIKPNRIRHAAEKVVLTALTQSIQDKDAWATLGDLLGASQYLSVLGSVPGMPSELAVLKNFLKRGAAGVELLGLSAVELDKTTWCHVVCLMPLARTDVHCAHDAIKSLASEDYKGVLLYRPSIARQAALFASELGLPLLCKVKNGQARGWSLSQDELRQLGLETF